MKKLLKQYGFNSDMQYYEMIVESYINGQYPQAKRQFLAMPVDNRKYFVSALIVRNWNHGLENNDIVFFTYI